MAQDDTKQRPGEPEFPPNTGRRPRFHALWHLSALEVVKDLTQTPCSDAWKKAACEPRVTVAIIDTMPAYTHPCLKGQIDFENGRDFSRRYGGEKIPNPNTRQKPLDYAFGAHGTAVAGLIAARPRADIELCIPPDATPYTEATSASAEPQEIDLPYSGINPYALIIPIVVSAAPEPAMLVAALTYAAGLEPAPDVVVIADSWDRHREAPAAQTQDKEQGAKKEDSPSDPDAYNARSDGPQNASSQLTSVGWDAVEDCVNELCKKSFVFCAAGNRPCSSLVFPASLSLPESGPWAVGACDACGNDLTYTPPSDQIRKNLNARLITTLSSEHPRWDRVTQKLDPWAKIDKELKIPDELFKNEFQPTDIVAIDVPGPAGYNPSPYDYFPPQDGTHLEFASLFCRFSGTSAATAIAAGLVSLAIALNKSQEENPSGPYKGPSGPELFALEQASLLVASGLPNRPKTD